MNKYQRIVLVVTALLVLIAWLFPPFIRKYTLNPNIYPRDLGYHFIWYYPNSPYFNSPYYVDYSRLYHEWIGIILIGVLVYFSLHKLDK